MKALSLADDQKTLIGNNFCRSIKLKFRFSIILAFFVCGPCNLNLICLSQTYVDYMSRLYEREIKDFFEVAKIKMAGTSKEAKNKFGKPPPPSPTMLCDVCYLK